MGKKQEEHAYRQMEKNTVKAANQLRESEMVRFYNPNEKVKRLLFLGNSITLHDAKPDIGWYHEHGMAASAPEKDYVHLVMTKCNEMADDMAYCVCQGAEWERRYQNGDKVFPLYESARLFHADIAVMRLIENCPAVGFCADAFQENLRCLLQYLAPLSSAQWILTTGFWRHPGDSAIADLAKELHLPLVTLGDLGERDEMKALGLFAHEGVANHPGDLGMQHIADRIFAAIKDYL